MRKRVALWVLVVALLGFGGLSYARDLTDTSAGTSGFPGTINTWTNEQDTDDPNHWNIINSLGNSIIAIETELGTDPAGTDTDVKTFLQSEHEVTGLHSGVATLNATTLKIGGTAITATAAEMNTVCDGVLTSSITWDPASIADTDEAAKEIVVTGAVLGDYAMGSFSLDVTDLGLDCQTTAANTVTCILFNNTGGAIDLASGTLRVMLLTQ
jgi:hypothetical protein